MKTTNRIMLRRNAAAIIACAKITPNKFDEKAITASLKPIAPGVIESSDTKKFRHDITQDCKTVRLMDSALKEK